MTATETTDQLRRALTSLRDLRGRYESLEASRHEPVALIGAACRVPGAADVDAFWSLLRAGGDAIVETPPERWDADALYDPAPDHPGTVATRWGGFLDDLAGFDAAFFGISPREAARMDPQQRLLLEVAWEALEHAGQPVEHLAGTPVGVFVGLHSHSDDYLALQAADPAELDVYSGTGTSHSVVAGRLSYLLDLHGPSLVVDTACSSSLVAVHLAVQSLRRGESSMAIVGGVNAILEPTATMLASRMRMMSPTGRCRPFDAAADGFVRSEGCGVVVLKRLGEAVADGDRVLAVIRGSAVNQDGRSNGLTAPNSRSQEAVIRAALADARIDPGAVGLIEAHGTGTPLGDPIELEALTAVFGAAGPDRPPCPIGSVKANIGHTEGAAGVISLIKAVRVVQAGEVPPLVHFDHLNPHIELDGTPFVVPTSGRPWPAGPDDRVVGISSFGWSGTNAHVVLAEAPAPAVADGPTEPAPSRPLVLPVSARDEAAQGELAAAYRDLLVDAPPEVVAGRCAAAAVRRSHLGHRLAVVGRTGAELVAGLDAVVAGEPAGGTAVGTARSALTAFVFPGQGSQWPGMAQGLLADEPAGRDVLAACSQAMEPYLGTSLRDRLASGDLGGDVGLVQPALFAVEVALAAVWADHGVVPDVVVGHSMGEVAAAHVAGALSLDDAARVICRRADLLRRISGRGAMALLELGADAAAAAVAAHGGRASVAVLDGPATTVVAGDPAAIDAIVADLMARDVFARRVDVDVASHSAQVDELLDELALSIEGIRPMPGRIPMWSTVTDRFEEGADLGPGYWVRNLRDPVRLAPAVRALAERGHTRLVEVSPHPVLLPALERTLADAGQRGVVVASMRRDRDEAVVLASSLGRLYADGLDPEWSRLVGAAPVVDLPSYPWQRGRHWLAPAAVRPGRRPAPDTDPLLGERIESPALAGALFQTEVSAHDPAFLDDHRVHGRPLVPAPLFLRMALAAAITAGRAGAVEGFEVLAPLVLDDGGARTVQLVLGPADAAGGTPFEVVSREPAGRGDWEVHARGRVVAVTGAAPSFSPDAVRAGAAEHVAGAALYERYARVGLDLGPRCRGVVGLWRRPGEALGRVEPTGATDGHGSTSLDAVRFDACLHVAAAAADDGAEPRFVVGIDEVQVHGALEGPLWSRAVVRPGTGLDDDAVVVDVEVVDDRGEGRARATGVRLRRADRSALGPRPAPVDPDWFYDVEWVAGPERGATEAVGDGTEGAGAEGAGATWVVVAGPGTALTDALVERLSATGRFASVVEPGRVGATLAEAEPGPRRIVLLAPDPVPVGGEVEGDRRDAAVRADGALAATTDRLAQALRVLRAVSAAGDGSRLWVVTRGGRAVDDDVPDAPQAALWGLGRVAALEHPDVWGGMVDLGPDPTPEDLDAAIAAVAADREDEVAVRHGRARVARLARRAPPPPAAPPALRPDGSYLVTGGLGGLGLKVASWLASRGAGTVVLVGRTPLPSRAEWATVDPASRTGAQVRGIRDAEALGATVTTEAVDVGDPAAMRALIARFGADLPPLRGIVHAAATLDPTDLGGLTDDALAAVLRPKVAGTALLHELSLGQPVDLFVLFSSTAAVWGSQGLGAYAAANQFLDATARARVAAGLPALSVDWGTWDEMRAFSATEQRSVARGGLLPLPSDGALAALERLLAGADGAPRPGAVVAAVDWSRLAPLYEARRRRPLFEVVGARAADARAADVEGALGVEPPLVAKLRGVPAGRRGDLVVAHVRAEVARIFGLSEPESLDVDRGLFDMGMDSLTSLELKGRIEADIGAPLPSTLVFNHPTVQALADHLLDEVLPAPAPAGARPADRGTVRDGDPDPAGAPSSAALAQEASAIRGLSDDEALAALLEGPGA